MPGSLLHAITASFHEIKDHRRRNKVDHEKAVHQQQYAAGEAPVAGTSRHGAHH